MLETKSNEVTTFDDELKTFVKDMHETMAKAGGIGLAANQVNDLRRVVVIHIPWIEPPQDDEEGAKEPDELLTKKEWWHDKYFNLINPEITKVEGRCRSQEGCLSFPGIFENVDRNKIVHVKAVDENGKPFELDADGLFSICLQHEIDHINGIVFINRMSRLKAGLVKRKLSKHTEFSEDLEEQS